MYSASLGLMKSLRLERSSRKVSWVEGMGEAGTMASCDMVARRPRCVVDVRRSWRACWSSSEAGS